MNVRSKLLIVDDSKEIRECIKHLLRKDFDVYIASNASQALNLQKELKIKIIVSDIEMPDMGGVELGKKLLENDNNCRIFAISGSDENILNARSSGIDFAGYLEKPFSLSELKNKIKQVESELLP